MTTWLYGISRRCARHAKLVILLWVVALVALGAANNLLSPGQPEQYVLSGTDSASAQQLLRQAFPGSANDANPVAIQDDDINFRSAQGTQALTEMSDAISENPNVSDVQTPDEGSNLISTDGHSAILNVVINDQSGGDIKVANEVLSAAQESAPSSSQVALGGIAGSQLSAPNTLSSEILGIGAALIVLAVAMRRFAGVLIPIVNAIAAVGIGLSVIEILGRVVFIPSVASTLAIMLGLGVGIDYALFLITRHRSLLRSGYEVQDSIGRTSGTAGAGMIFAGGTLIAALCGLTLTGISFLAWIGYAAAIVVCLAVASSITLVPALLAVFGDRVVPKNAEPISQGDAHLDVSKWGRLANAVTTKPWRYAIISTLLLLVLASPMLNMSLGTSDSSSLPESTTARQADDIITNGFGPGMTAPMAVVVQLYTPAQAAEDGSSSETGGSADQSDPRTSDPRLTQLRTKIGQTSGIETTSAPIVSTDGGVAVIRATTDYAASNPLNEDVVEDLRENVLPQASSGQGMTAYVGGLTPARADLYDQIIERTPWFIGGVVAMSFLLLMLAYRSLLIPLKAAIMNLLAISAAYGVVTAVFDWGWGSSLIGLQEPIPIDAYVPMMMFAVLFGLSMDYEVFLLTSIREHWEKTQNMKTAIRRGLADTGKLVTAAALIMVVVFSSFIVSDFGEVKLFGVGLATAVAVDATIVRCLLVPSVMILAAKGTWWLPGWLDRLLPHLHVEGDPEQLNDAAAKLNEQSSKTVVAIRPIAAIGVSIGVGLAWLLISRIPSVPDFLLPAVALSAVLAGITLLLPPWLGGGNTGRATRTFGFLAGVLLGTFAVGVVSLIATPENLSTGVAMAWGIIILAVLVVISVRRTIALPVVFGALSTAVAFTMSFGADTSTQQLLMVCALPIIVTAIVFYIVGSIARGLGFNEQVPPPSPSEMEPVESKESELAS